MKILKILLWFLVMALGTVACNLALIGGQRVADKIAEGTAWLANKLQAKNLPVIPK